VYGVLEDHWSHGTDVKAGIDLAVRAVSAAMRRDAASGEGIDVAVITRDGFREIEEQEIERRKGAMKIP